MKRWQVQTTDEYEFRGFDEWVEQLEETYGMYMGHYGMDGERLSTREWFNLRMEDPLWRRVARTTVGDYEVSTVLLGTDHNWNPKGPPIIFETMIFDKTGHGIWTDRYSNKVAALAGHDQAVELARSGRVPHTEDDDDDC